MRTKFLKLALLFTLSASALTANADYNSTLIQNNTSASSINNSGQIVGKNGSRAAYWSGYPPSFTQLGSSGSSEAYSINNSGQIVGSMLQNGSRYATLWNSTNLTSNPTLLTFSPNSNVANAYSINTSGQIVGGSIDGNSNFNGLVWSAANPASDPTILQSSGGLFTQASGNNDLGQIVGSSSLGALLWTSSSASPTILQASGDEIRATNINNSGQIIGSSQNSSITRALLWTSSSDSSSTLEALGGNQKNSEALDINNSGVIVGYSFNSSNLQKATLWNGTNSPIDLNDYLDSTLKTQGWVLTRAMGINDNGSIIGIAEKRGGEDIISSSFLLSPVPESDTSAMLLMGAGVMRFMARRRKQAAA